VINSGQSTGMGLHGTLRERCFGHGCVIVQQFTALTRKRTRGLLQATTELPHAHLELLHALLQDLE